MLIAMELPADVWGNTRIRDVAQVVHLYRARGIIRIGVRAGRRRSVGARLRDRARVAAVVVGEGVGGAGVLEDGGVGSGRGGVGCAVVVVACGWGEGWILGWWRVGGAGVGGVG